MNARFGLLIGIVAALLVGAFWQPFDPDAIDLLARHAGPSPGHLLGTDQLGRDLLSRLMAGGWRTAVVLLIVATTGFGVGCSIGVGAALLGGIPGAALMRAAELFIATPTLIVAIVAAAVFGLNPVSAGLALGLAGVGPYALLSHALAQRSIAQQYVQAARAMGLSNAGVALRHVGPDIVPVLLAHLGSNSGVTIVAFASLAFLGIGADPSIPNWGSMLFEYRGFLFDDPWLMVWPGLAIALTSLALNATFDADNQ